MRLFDILPDVCLFAKDDSGKFILANRNFVRMCGFPNAGQLLGLTDFDVFPAHLAAKYVRDDKQVMRSGKPLSDQVELVIGSAKTTDWHTTTKVPILDPETGNVVGVAGYTRSYRQVKSGAGRFSAMEKVVDHVMENYTEAIAIKNLAALAFLSVSQFERRFKALFGISPLKYVSMIRVLAACQALAGTDEPISRISSKNGFYDLSHFNRQFRMHMGMTPGAYRKKFSAQAVLPEIRLPLGKVRI